METALTLSLLYEYLEQELKMKGLGKIPRRLYGSIAQYMKEARKDGEGKDVISRLKAREMEVLSQLSKRLLEVRFKKILELQEEDKSLENITPEEKYICEARLLSKRRLQRVADAISKGQTALLEALPKVLASRYTMVRFLKDAPPVVGSDLRRYGPFKQEDFAVLPVDNARAFKRAGVVAEVWIEG